MDTFTRIEFWSPLAQRWTPARPGMTWEKAKTYGVKCRIIDRKGNVIREWHPSRVEVLTKVEERA